MDERNETKVCKHCQTEIPKKAKICPNCRKKQGGIGKWIAIGVVALIIIVIVASGGDDSKDNSGGSQTASKNTDETVAIEYTKVSVDDMVTMLNDNSLKAETTYKDQYVEITGKLSNIDSDGKYISLDPVNDEWSLYSVQCYIKSDEQKAKVIEMSIGNTVTLKGKIKSVGEIMGYSLDIDEIIE